MPHPSAGSRTTLPRVLAPLLVAVLLTGCSGDPAEPGSAPSETAGQPSVVPAERIASDTRVGVVVGKLGRKKRTRAVTQVGRMADRWLDAAYVEGQYPREAFGRKVFRGWTPGARRAAMKDRGQLTNRDLGGRIDSLEVRKRVVTVDLLSTGRRARAATARVRLVFRTHGDLERRVSVNARLRLVRADGGWRVFAYDVAKGRG